MRTPVKAFDYDLPKELIALYPAEKRDNCRLMILDTCRQEITNAYFYDIAQLLNENHFLVVNNAKADKARLPVRKTTGGKSEIFITEVTDANHARAMIRGKMRSGTVLNLKEYSFKLLEKYDDGSWLVYSERNIKEAMEEIGHVPLPPYIDREDTDEDKINYQTVYAKTGGSCAAPTAGLHFTENLMTALKNKGVEIIEITLNVGLGTFMPVKTEFMENHKIHAELCSIPEQAAKKINALKRAGKTLVAVGSTSVRALETAADEKGFLKHGDITSEIFITPPYNFKIVDNMITNFHLPKSTLIAMVSALAGYDFIMRSYKKAIEDKYRFFSYGDAMYIKRK